MAHGAPDDSNVLKDGLVNRLDDLGELAARLGSPVKYHRTGDVVYIDDFEWGLNGWVSTGTNVDRYCQVSNVASLSKGNCCLLNSGSGGLLPIYMTNRHPAVKGDTIGFHVSLSLRSNIVTFGMNTYVYTPATIQKFAWQWVKATSWLYCRTTAGAAHTIDLALPLYEDDTLFHHFKMIVNQSTGFYVGLYVDDVYYDLSAVPVWLDAPGGDKHISTYIVNAGSVANAAEIALDDFVITVNE